MWSRLTEYAEKGIAEIVASADDSAGASQEEDELWTRFTSIVAPPPASNSPRRQQEKQEKQDNRPPLSTSSTRSTGDTEASTGALQAGEDEDEQEQYIYELERALLQRKKQNEALEAKLRELEAAPTVGNDSELKSKIQALEQELAREKAEHEKLLRTQHHSEDYESLTAQVGALETRLASLQARCAAVQSRLDAERGRAALASTGGAGLGSRDDAEPSIFPALVQITVLLRSALALDRSEVPASEEEMADQILALTRQAKESLEASVARVRALERSIGSFLAQHKGHVDFGIESTWSSQLQTKLGVLSHRLAKADSGSAELRRVQAQLEAVEAESDVQFKKMLQLQAQVNSVQASKQRSDKSMQQIATKELQLVEAIELKDRDIERLEAQIAKMKNSLDILGQELENSHLEVDDVVTRAQAQQHDLNTLQTQLVELQTANEALQQENNDARSRAAEYEQGYMNLLSELEDLKQQSQAEKVALLASTEAHAESADSQALYELESRLKAAEADKEVAEQDAERLQKELNALEGVLHDFQATSKVQKERVAGLEAALEEAKQAQKMTKSAGVQEDDDFERVMAVLAKKTQECDQLREALENAASQYSTERDVLDKRLAAQLVVAYIDSDKKGDVLQLMAGMMGFTEDQKRRVGLGYAMEGHGGGGLFSSIIGLVAPPENASAAPVAIDGKSFTEMLSDFLVEEAAKK